MNRYEKLTQTSYEGKQFKALLDSLREIRELSSNVDDHWGANPWENLEKIRKITDEILWPG